MAKIGTLVERSMKLASMLRIMDGSAQSAPYMQSEVVAMQEGQSPLLQRATDRGIRYGHLHAPANPGSILA